MDSDSPNAGSCVFMKICFPMWPIFPTPTNFILKNKFFLLRSTSFKKIVKELLGYFTLILFPVPMDSSKCKKIKLDRCPLGVLRIFFQLSLVLFIIPFIRNNLDLVAGTHYLTGTRKENWQPLQWTYNWCYATVQGEWLPEWRDEWTVYDWWYTMVQGNGFLNEGIDEQDGAIQCLGPWKSFRIILCDGVLASQMPRPL